MSDKYGIPGNMFGPVSEEFYALIGRVAMVATMLEDHLLGLLWAMDDAPQERYAGQPFSKIAQRSRILAEGLDHPHPEMAAELIDDVERVMQRRNEIVHSLWARPQLEDALGWRHVVAKRRADAWNPVVWIEINKDEIAETISTMVQLIARCDALAMEAHSDRSRRMS